MITKKIFTVVVIVVGFLMVSFLSKASAQYYEDIGGMGYSGGEDSSGWMPTTGADVSSVPLPSYEYTSSASNEVAFSTPAAYETSGYAVNAAFDNSSMLGGYARMGNAMTQDTLQSFRNDYSGSFGQEYINTTQQAQVNSGPGYSIDNPLAGMSRTEINNLPSASAGSDFTAQYIPNNIGEVTPALVARREGIEANIAKWESSGVDYAPAIVSQYKAALTTTNDAITEWTTGWESANSGYGGSGGNGTRPDSSQQQGKGWTGGDLGPDGMLNFINEQQNQRQQQQPSAGSTPMTGEGRLTAENNLSYAKEGLTNSLNNLTQAEKKYNEFNGRSDIIAYYDIGGTGKQLWNNVLNNVSEVNRWTAIAETRQQGLNNLISK